MSDDLRQTEDYNRIHQISRLINFSIIAKLFTAMPEAIYDRTNMVKENNMNFDYLKSNKLFRLPFENLHRTSFQKLLKE